MTALGGPVHSYGRHVDHLYFWTKVGGICMLRRLHIHLLMVHPTSTHSVCPSWLLVLHGVIYPPVIRLVIGLLVLDAMVRKTLREV